MRSFAAIAALLAAGCTATPAPQLPAAAAAQGASACADDAGWNEPAAPFRIHGDTWFVGTCGITALLVTSTDGHVLLDTGTGEAAPQIIANVRAAGFRVEDIRYIVNSHAHMDHAGGIAAIQAASGATVVALEAARPALLGGRNGPDDPQYGQLPAFAAVDAVRVLADGEALRVGPLALVAHATPGHAPGGTSWTWRSCEAGRCLDIAFADSLTAVAAPGFRFGDEASHPALLPTLRASYARVAALPCDILLTPHPRASAMWSRMGPRADRPLADPGACRAYAAAAAQGLDARLREERATP